jgi:mono/diheme cytochrome c family protein
MMCVFGIRNGYLLLLIFSLSAAGCEKKIGDAVTSSATFIPAGVTTKNVTHTNYVAAVLKNNCSTCHGKGGSAEQFWLNTNTYQNAAEYGERIVETIVNGSMPPVPRKPFSDADRQMMQAWLHRGMPQ